MGAAASVSGGDDKAKENMTTDEIVEKLLPHFMDDEAKCNEIFKAVTEKAKEKKAKEAEDAIKADTIKKETDNNSGIKGFGSEIATVINKVRENPKSFIPVAEKHLNSFVDDFHHKDSLGRENIRIETKEGKQAVLDLIEYLKKAEGLSSVGFLSNNELLERAAVDHMTDICKREDLSHNSSNGHTTRERIEKHGHWRGVIAELLDGGNNDPELIVLALLVDDGIASKAHREIIMNSQYLLVGAALGPHPTYSHCCIMDFATKMFSWNDIQTVDIEVVADSPMTSSAFNKVVRSIPVENIDVGISEMLASPGSVVTITFKHKEGSAVIAHRKDNTIKQMSYQWGSSS